MLPCELSWGAAAPVFHPVSLKSVRRLGFLGNLHAVGHQINSQINSCLNLQALPSG
jgi:hypothetical protein